MLVRFYYFALKISNFLGYQLSIKQNSVHPRMYGPNYNQAYLQKIAMCLNSAINFVPKNIVEVRANLAQDSRFLSNHWAQINAFAIAVSNADGQTELNLPDSPNNDIGFASILKREFTDRFFSSGSDDSFRLLDEKSVNFEDILLKNRCRRFVLGSFAGIGIKHPSGQWYPTRNENYRDLKELKS